MKKKKTTGNKFCVSHLSFFAVPYKLMCGQLCLEVLVIQAPSRVPNSLRFKGKGLSHHENNNNNNILVLTTPHLERMQTALLVRTGTLLLPKVRKLNTNNFSHDFIIIFAPFNDFFLQVRWVLDSLLLLLLTSELWSRKANSLSTWLKRTTNRRLINLQVTNFFCSLVQSCS